MLEYPCDAPRSPDRWYEEPQTGGCMRQEMYTAQRTDTIYTITIHTITLFYILITWIYNIYNALRARILIVMSCEDGKGGE